LVAASSESASRTENPPTNGLLTPWDDPAAVTVAAGLSGEPMSIRAGPTLPAQFIQSSIPAWAAWGSALPICSAAETEDR